MKKAIEMLTLFSEIQEDQAQIWAEANDLTQADYCRYLARTCRESIAVLERACAPTETITLSKTDAEWIVGVIAEPKDPNEKLQAAKQDYDKAIEQEIQAKGLTAPRITPADIEANIIKEFYFTGQEAVFGACTIAHGKPVWSDGADIALLTFCVLVLRNGFTVTGESACASPENFDAELGRKIARQNAVNKVWPLMGYALKERLAQEVEWPEPSGLVLTEADAIADLKAADDRIIIGAAQVDTETEQAVVQMLCASARRCVEMAIKCFRVGDIEGARAFSSEGAKMAEAIKQLMGDDDGEVSGLIRDIANFVDHLSGEPRPDAGRRDALNECSHDEPMLGSSGHLLTQSELDAIADKGLDSTVIAVAAELCHEANRAYCKALGDDSQPCWGDAPEWQRVSAIAGVEFHIANPDAGPSHSHENWLEHKRAEGWKYGPVKDAEKKEHPCFVPYDDLPPEQKAKDYIFEAIVKTVAGINRG